MGLSFFYGPTLIWIWTNHIPGRVRGKKQKFWDRNLPNPLTESKKASITGGKSQKWSRGGDTGQRDGKPDHVKSYGLV